MIDSFKEMETKYEEEMKPYKRRDKDMKRERVQRIGKVIALEEQLREHREETTTQTSSDALRQRIPKNSTKLDPLVQGRTGGKFPAQYAHQRRVEQSDVSLP
jgi:hypothetical protein